MAQAAATKFLPWLAPPSPPGPTVCSPKSMTTPSTLSTTAHNLSNRIPSHSSWPSCASSPPLSAAGWLEAPNASPHSTRNDSGHRPHRWFLRTRPEKIHDRYLYSRLGPRECRQRSLRPPHH